MKVWRLNIKTAAKEGINPGRFCLERNILGVGWQVNQLGDVNWDKYIAEAKGKYKKYGRKFTAAINAIKNRMKVDDLCWTRDKNGNYFLGIITSDWRYDSSEECSLADVVNIRSCEWHNVGTVDIVPGKIVNSYISGSTVQQVKGNNILSYSQYLANKISKNNRYDITKSDEGFISLISSEDCEDIVAIYMQKIHGYMMIPSSCKKDTAVYEYVMKHHITGEKAVAQVKHGNVNLDQDKYKNINAQTFLLTTKGKYIGSPAENVHCLDAEKLIQFATDNYSLMPDRVQNWIDLDKKLHT